MLGQAKRLVVIRTNANTVTIIITTVAEVDSRTKKLKLQQEL